MKIRKATKKDLKEISDIFREETSKQPYFQKWTQKTALEKVHEFFKKDDIHLVLVERKIVGFVVSRINSEGKEAYIEELWLRSAYQGKGTGTILMNFVEENYKNKGVASIGIMANQKAKAVYFYKKLRYKIKHAFFYMSKKLK